MHVRDTILGMLMNKSLSGYDIKQSFEQLFSYFFDASFGTIYPTLKKLEGEGKITKETVPQEGKPNKHLYSITDKGREEFANYLHSPLERDVLRSDMLMRLYFGNFASDEVIEIWFRQSLQFKQRALDTLLRDYERYKPYLTPTQEISLLFGIKQHESNIEELQDGLAKIQSITK